MGSQGVLEVREEDCQGLCKGWTPHWSGLLTPKGRTGIVGDWGEAPARMYGMKVLYGYLC